MPGFDGTGPLGQGRRTGGGFGWCPPGIGPVGTAPLGGIVCGVGRGGRPYGGGRGRCFGGGRGQGRGFGWRVPYVWPQPAPEQETAALKHQAGFFQAQLDAIQKRLDELTKEPTQT